jgi:abortive infection bacteriophage resistance protein
MKYTKPALSIRAQVEKLKERGLIIDNTAKAEHYLSNISFYRLRAYTYPFQDNSDPNHPFIVQKSFEDIVKLYVFDRKLRLLLLDAIEKIEVSLRTQLIYHFSIKHGSHWYTDENLYRNRKFYDRHLDDIEMELDRSIEDFIKHYDSKYTDPPFPPSWMTLEIINLGDLSRLYKNLKWNCGSKLTIAKHYGLKDVATLENWTQCFANIRNVCAHHSRLWNRRHMPITLLCNPSNPFPDTDNIYPYKTYSYICCISYILKIINPQNTFTRKLRSLFEKYPLNQENDMGFQEDWRDHVFWN